MRAEMEGSKVFGNLNVSAVSEMRSLVGSGPPRNQRLTLAKKLMSFETPNVEVRGDPPALSAERPLDCRVGPLGEK